MKLWYNEKNEDGHILWSKKDNIHSDSTKTIRLESSDIEWIETYSYKGCIITKTHYFSSGRITISIDSGLDLSIFKNNSHQFSIYDLDGKYSFKGGDFDLHPDEDSLKSDYGWDNVFEELDYIGTDSSQVVLSSINIKE
mgnify:FL=1